MVFLLTIFVIIMTVIAFLVTVIDTGMRGWLYSRDPVWKALRSLNNTKEWVKGRGGNVYIHKSHLMRFEGSGPTFYVSDKPMYDPNTGYAVEVGAKIVSMSRQADERYKAIIKKWDTEDARVKVEKALNYKMEQEKAEKKAAEAEKEAQKKLKSVDNIGSF